MTIGAVPVLLADVTCPVLNIYAQLDHLVPPAASTALADHVGSADYTESAFDGGHIGIYVSQRAQRRIPATIAGWLQARQ
jgi:polyhydroxyalkanoate synthase